MRDVLPSGLAKVRCLNLRRGLSMRYFSWRGSERVGKEGGRAAKKGLRKMHLIKKQTYQKVNTDLAYFQGDLFDASHHGY